MMRKGVMLKKCLLIHLRRSSSRWFLVIGYVFTINIKKLMTTSPQKSEKF